MSDKPNNNLPSVLGLAIFDNDLNLIKLFK